jgi:hypothetical protein
MKKFLPPYLWLLLFLVSIGNSYAQALKPKIIDTNGTVHTIVQSGDTVFIGGSFSTVGFNTGAAAKLTTSSDVPDHDFPRLNWHVYAAIPDGAGGWYVSGPFSYQAGGQTRNYMAHVLADKTLDPDFNPQPNGIPTTMILSGSTLYVAGGGFTQIGGQNRQYLAALSTSTGQATSWNPSPNSSIYSIALDGSTLYAAGSFSQIGGQERYYLAALNTSNGQATS